MTEQRFRIAMLLVMISFILMFALVVIPALFEERNLVTAFAAGFVNPFAAGYSVDVILCWVSLVAWISYEKRAYRVKGDWTCILLGVLPGVAVGFPLYLLLRSRQINQKTVSA